MEPEGIDALLVGSGGREHALAWKLRQSPRCRRLYAAPGNPGIAPLAECVDVGAGDVQGLARLAMERRVGLVVIGPEAPLAAGLADRLRESGILVFGPSAAAARIESSKAYARDLMARRDVPQPRYARFTATSEAFAYLDRLERSGTRSVVVKASGLAAGKGAVVCDTLEAARATIRAMIEQRAFGDAGEEVLVEERLHGREASLFVLTDGRDAVALLPAQDFKRAEDGDRGPNTGGMGACAPAPALGPALAAEALERIVRPTLLGLAEDGAPFQGCLYAGLMLTDRGLMVIEFNCRFGDPETQAVLPLLESDLLELMLAAASGSLGHRELCWKPDRAVTVVVASGGYPGAYETGCPIGGLEEAAAQPGALVFHAGTACRGGAVVTAGGRVLNVTGTGPTFAAAGRAAYAAVQRIDFQGCRFRSDIASGLRD